MVGTYNNPSPSDVETRRAELAPFDSWNERALCALFATLYAWRGPPRAYLDLGSGTGAMVNMSRKMGIPAYGVDLIANGPGREYWFLTHDLSRPLHLLAPDHQGRVFLLDDEFVEADLKDGVHQHVAFDLITCLEVGEHLPEDSSRVLVESIARHLAVADGILVFSAAPPGQTGEHHVNCKPATWWRSLFYDYGVSYREDYTRQLSHIWSWVAGPLSWLGANVQIFDR